MRSSSAPRENARLRAASITDKRRGILYTMATAANTQDLVDIKEIRENTVILKSGKICQVLIIGGLNFSLKSEAEQNVITQAYQNFLNSLNFPIQIIIHSRKLSIHKYLDFLETRRGQESSPLLQDQIAEYKDFVGKLVAENAIMIKTFLVTVSFTSASLPSSSGFFSSIPGMGKKNDTKKQDAENSMEFRANLQQLTQRVSQVQQGLSAIGLDAAVLDEEQLVELFYNFYNPETVEKDELPVPKQ